MKALYDFISLPETIIPALESASLTRLKQIDMNCGLNYTQFPLFTLTQPYSRYEHSVGVAKLLHYFQRNEKEILAGLFHDIATPVFSHVADFMNNDYLIQESTEQPTERMIQNDPLIQAVLARLGLRTCDVCDYHQYPIADNDSPKLSCDRLEYTLGNLVNFQLDTPDFVSCVLEDLIVDQNESGEIELQFQTESIALTFAFYALRCGYVYSGRQDRYAMEFLSNLLKRALSESVIESDDLETSESAVIDKLLHSPLKDEWMKFRGFYDVIDSDENDGLKINAKRRYIDPLIRGRGRSTEINSKFKRMVDNFLSEDYDVWLKGLSHYETNCNCQRQ